MKSRFDAALRLLSAAAPALVAAANAARGAVAAHDDGVVRTVGAGSAGALRALDLFVAAPAMLAPIGTRVLRASLASALVCAACGAIAYGLARALVALVVPGALERLGLPGKAASPRLLSAVAAAAVLTALLSPAWQSEASAPGGAVTGALLVLVAVSLAVAGPLGGGGGARGPSSALVLGLAASYEPLVFVAALAAFAPGLAAAARAGLRERRLDRARVAHVACAFLLGLVPLAAGLALSLRPPEIALPQPALPLIDRAPLPVSVASFASAEIGALLLAACAGGALLTLLVGAARRALASLVLVVAVGALATALGMPAGPARFGAPLLAAVACAYVLGATALGAIVLAIARARVPFAEASAALVVVLELVLPVRAIDETTTRRDVRAPRAATIWNDVAWGDAPPAAVLLVADRGTMRRIAVARATGEMRGDLVVVPAYDVQGRQGQRALVAEPKLAPLYRDMALGVTPEELSLARLGAERGLLATFDPRWDRALARHLVPVGLTSRFEAEPRGASDRKLALDAFTPSKERLVRVTVTKRDPELAAATARLLRARALGMAASGEREMLSRALDDLRAFAPDDPIGATLVRRVVTTKGPIDVRDLSFSEARR